MKIPGNNIVQKLCETPPTIKNLPASDGTPLKIVTTGTYTASVTVYSTSDFFWTNAKTDAIAATRITDDDTRGKFPAGIYEFQCSGNHDDNLYLVSSSSAVTDGISYSINEFA